MNVIHAAHNGTTAFAARSLETGDHAVIVTTPYPPTDPFEGLCGAPTTRDGHRCKSAANESGSCMHHPSEPSGDVNGRVAACPSASPDRPVPLAPAQGIGRSVS